MNYMKFLMALAVMVTVMGAQTARAESSVVVVNIQKIMQESSAAKMAREQLKSKQRQFQEQLGKRESELQKKDQELAKQRASLSKEAFEKQVMDFRKQAASAQKEVQAKRLQLNKAFDSALGTIQKTVTAIIGDLSKEKGFAIAIPASQALYSKPELDISSEVLSRLNSKLPTLNVKF